MNDKEIIEMAEKSDYLNLSFDRGMELKELRAFAKLVAEKEREACANLADEIDPTWESVSVAIRARKQE